MSGLLVKENELGSFEKVRSSSRALSAKESGSQQELASLLMQAVSILGNAEHKMKALESSYRNQEASALYRQDSQELARLAREQRALQAELSQELQQAKGVTQEIGAGLELLGANLASMDVQEGALLASALKEYANALPADELRILPEIPAGNNPGALPVPAQPVYSQAFLMRKMQFQKMLQELLALIEAAQSGEAPRTGYPIGLIFMMTSIAVIEQREIEAQALVAKQQALNDVASRFNEILFLLNQIKNGKGDGNMDPEAIAEMADKLRASLTSLFGKQKEIGVPDGWYFESDGTFVPGTNSEFGRLITALGPNYKSNPVYGMISRFAKSLDTDMQPPKNPDDTNFPVPPQRSFLEAFLGKEGERDYDYQQWVATIHRNYYNGQLPTPIKGKDYMGPLTQSTSSIQSGVTGFSGQVTLQMQQQMADITTFSDITKKMLESLDALIRSINQGSR